MKAYLINKELFVEEEETEQEFIFINTNPKSYESGAPLNEEREKRKKPKGRKVIEVLQKLHTIINHYLHSPTRTEGKCESWQAGESRSM